MKTYADKYVRYKIANPQDYTPVDMADALNELLDELRAAESRIEDLENEVVELKEQE